MSNIKVTFGLQDRHIKRIEEERTRWNNIGPEEAEALFIHAFWVDLAKEFSWEPLTLALWYFRFHFSRTDETGVVHPAGKEAENEQPEPPLPDVGICAECKSRPATTDYNEYGYFVCKLCYDSLNREFDEEYR